MRHLVYVCQTYSTQLPKVRLKWRFLFGYRNENITQFKDKLDKCYGDSTPSVSIVKIGLIEFHCGRTSTSDAYRSERPIEVALPKNLKNPQEGVVQLEKTGSMIAFGEEESAAPSQ